MLYTNVLHYKAMVSFAAICESVDRLALALKYSQWAKSIQAKVTELFWNGRYFVDWIDHKGRKHDYFSTDGNMWAIVFGLATMDQACKIQKTTQELGLDKGFSTHSNHPSYPASKIYPLFLFLNIYLLELKIQTL